MKKFKDFKVLLVYPNFPMASVLLPAGVSIISAILKKEGFQCRLFDTTLYKPKGESQKSLEKSFINLKQVLIWKKKLVLKILIPTMTLKIY